MFGSNKQKNRQEAYALTVFCFFMSKFEGVLQYKSSIMTNITKISTDLCIKYKNFGEIQFIELSKVVLKNYYFVKKEIVL